MADLDLGNDVVERVRQQLEGQRHGSVWPRGFSCSRQGLVQWIWSAQSVDYANGPAWCVHVRTSVLAGFDGSPAQCEALSLDMADGALAAVIRDPQDHTRLQLASTFHVHAGNARWAAGFAVFVARWQASEAAHLARTAALLGLGARPDLAAAASPGLADDPEDDLVDRRSGAPAAVARVWPAAEVLESVELLRMVGGAHATTAPRGLVASLASAHASAVQGRVVLEVDTAAQRPRLGRGLSVLLMPPPRAGGAELALALNESEILPQCRTDLLGGWSVRDGVLRHSAFFPDAVHRPGLLLHLVLAAVRRVEWST
jgi:hypothetical protein